MSFCCACLSRGRETTPKKGAAHKGKETAASSKHSGRGKRTKGNSPPASAEITPRKRIKMKRNVIRIERDNERLQKGGKGC